MKEYELDEHFINILKKLIDKHGKEPLLDPSKAKAFLADYARREYREESSLIIKAVEAGVTRELAASNDKNLISCIERQSKLLRKTVSIKPKVALDAVNVLAHVLRGVPLSSAETKAQPKPVREEARIDNNMFDEAMTLLDARRYSKAVPLLKALAGEGNDEAQFYLGECYDIGNGLKKDYTKALEWYHKSAEQGNAKACYGIAGCYRSGNGVNKDIVIALGWYRKAIAGYSRAYGPYRAVLRDLLLSGVSLDGIMNEFEEALAHFTAGDMSNLPDSEKKAYMQKAIILFETLAGQDNAEAQNMLGYCYLNAHGVMEDLGKSTQWFIKAAEKGHAEAQWRVGNSYAYSMGVIENYSTAAEWYNKAAQQGNTRAVEALNKIKGMI
ncbi:MAG: sel1 repeat family protein [Treponema sp.]|jgi:TPR repeat protein|nr:sel1 repeat family protein [Treponema sp.]